MQQLKVLTMIAIDPERATGHELAAQLNVSVATMSGLVDRLVEHGMVTRGEDPSDRRVRRLTVTAEGSATIRSLLSTAGTMPTPSSAGSPSRTYAHSCKEFLPLTAPSKTWPKATPATRL